MPLLTLVVCVARSMPDPGSEGAQREAGVTLD
jgi:hypothetical protein